MAENINPQHEHKAEHPVVHIAVDVQGKYTWNLSPEREKSFPGQVSAFAEHLDERGVPTIWVGVATKTRVIAGLPQSASAAERTQRRQLLEDYRFKNVDIYDDQPVFIKNTDDAFELPELSQLLDLIGAKILIVSGMHTGLCVASTIMSGAQRYHCIAAVDMMANAKNNISHEGTRGGDPNFHYDQLKNRIDRSSISDETWRRIFYKASDEILADVGRKTLVPPTLKTSAQLLQNSALTL